MPLVMIVAPMRVPPVTPVSDAHIYLAPPPTLVAKMVAIISEYT